MIIRLASNLQKDSIVDGNGIRMVLWTQGCPHNCEGCHNPETHNFNKGIIKDIDEVIKEIGVSKGQDGITFSGGEPFCQTKPLIEIAKFCHSIGLNVWCYTGYKYEYIINNPDMKLLLEEIDVLVDGKFELKNKSLNVLFRGSTNQRLIDVKESISKQEVVELEEKCNNDKKESYVYI